MSAVDDLRALNILPDLIHGQHHLDAMTAMLQFPDVPAIFVAGALVAGKSCHRCFRPSGATRCGGRPVPRTATTYAMALLLSGSTCFTTLSTWTASGCATLCPERLHRRSSSATRRPTAASVPAIREARQAFGIERIDVAGSASGNAIAQPERVLGGYDIVFGKARCALEAMSVGCATVVADLAGLGGMVDTDNMQWMRRLNFGVRTMQAGTISKDGVLSALRAYNPANARQVTEWIRSEVDLSAAVDRLLTTYDRAMHARPSAEKDQQARTSLADASAYLRKLAPVIKTRSG